MRLKVSKPGPLPKEALEYFAAKSVSPDIDIEKVWGEEHDFAFTAAGLADEALLSELKAAVEKAIGQGQTYTDFAAGIDDVIAALGWKGENDKPSSRLKLIFDTNMRTARAAGQWARIVRTADDGRAYLEYSLGPAVQHREEHASWAGTILRYDDAWWATHYPPNGFKCHCRVRQLSDAEAERRGISSAPPAGDPDPGWDRNPGASRGS